MNGCGKMANLTIDGFDGLLRNLSKVGEKSEDVVKEAVSKGGGVIADEVRKNINALPIVNGYGSSEKPLAGGVNEVQKKGLQDSFGVSPAQRFSNDINVSIGFDGYNKIKTKKFPKGQPNQLVARATESGTSWKQKHPFIRPAVNKARKKAIETTENFITTEIKKIMED